VEKIIKSIHVINLDKEFKVSRGARDKIKEYHLSLSSTEVVEGD
jgi:hypothetical protein